MNNADLILKSTLVRRWCN